MRHKVIDNFLPSQQANLIEEVMFGENFPWYNGATLSPHGKHYQTCEIKRQFVHMFYGKMRINSNYFDQLIQPIVDAIAPSALIRVKANLHVKTENQLLTGYHKDMESPFLTAIYYVNTNNGFTVFKDGDKIESVKNRLLVFDANLLHCGTTCTDSNYRCVINFNFYGSSDGVNV